MSRITADELNRWVDFDSPFGVDVEGNVTRAHGFHAPAVYHVEGEREPEIDGSGWEFVDGYSGQYGYNGPVMHASEQLAGGIAQDVLKNPGIYVVTVVEVLDDMDNPAGWVLLKHQTAGVPLPAFSDERQRANPSIDYENEPFYDNPPELQG